MSCVAYNPSALFEVQKRDLLQLRISIATKISIFR